MSNNTKSDLVVRFMSGVYGLSPSAASVVADYILADRQRICAPLIEMRNIRKQLGLYEIEDVAMDGAIKLAGLNKKS